MKRYMGLLMIWALVISMSGCEGVGTKQAVGTALGGALGGLAGSRIGKNEGRLAATAGGALLGAWLGAEIGKSLDKADQLYAAQATQNALERNPSGQATTWKNPDNGHAGTVTPTRTFKERGRDCREFEQVVTIEGRQETVKGTACREDQGWRIL